MFSTQHYSHKLLNFRFYHHLRKSHFTGKPLVISHHCSFTEAFRSLFLLFISFLIAHRSAYFIYNYKSLSFVWSGACLSLCPSIKRLYFLQNEALI